MLKACKDEDLYLVVEKDQMQVAIKTDESFGAITVRWCCSGVVPWGQHGVIFMLVRQRIANIHWYHVQFSKLPRETCKNVSSEDL